MITDVKRDSSYSGELKHAEIGCDCTTCQVKCLLRGHTMRWAVFYYLSWVSVNFLLQNEFYTRSPTNPPSKIITGSPICQNRYIDERLRDLTLWKGEQCRLAGDTRVSVHFDWHSREKWMRYHQRNFFYIILIQDNFFRPFTIHMQQSNLSIPIFPSFQAWKMQPSVNRWVRTRIIKKILKPHGPANCWITLVFVSLQIVWCIHSRN